MKDYLHVHIYIKNKLNVTCTCFSWLTKSQNKSCLIRSFLYISVYYTMSYTCTSCRYFREWILFDFFLFVSDRISLSVSLKNGRRKTICWLYDHFYNMHK